MSSRPWRGLQRGEIVNAFDAGGLRHPGVVHELAERMAEVVGGAVDPVRDHEMLEIGQRQLALHQQHPGIHAKRAIAIECDHRALGAERDAGGEHEARLIDASR
jgi:hypothetical protein